MTAAGHEAAELAGHPTHSLAKYTAVSVLGGTASGVATYQANTHLAKLSNNPTPGAASPVTGGMPSDSGENISKAAHNMRKKYKDHKGG